MSRPTPPKLSLWQNILYNFQKLYHYEGPKYLLLMPLAVVCQVFAPLLTVALPGVVVSQLQSGKSWQEIFAAVTLLSLVLTLLTMGKSYTQQALPNIAFLFRIDFAEEFLFRAIHLPYEQLEDSSNKLTEQAQRYVYSGNDIGCEAFASAVTDGLCQLVGFAVYLAVSARLSPWILLVLLSTTVGIAILSGWRRKWLLKHYMTEVGVCFTRNLRFRARLVDPKCAKDIHLYGMKPWLSDTLEAFQGLRLSLEEKRFRGDCVALLGQQLLSLIRDVLVYGYLIIQLGKGMTVADFILYVGVAAGLSNWLAELLNQFREMQANSDLCTDFRRYMDHLPRKKAVETPKSTPIPNPGHAHTLVLEHVSYRYPNSETDALHDVTLTIHSGEKLALVGANGAGKSTLVKLLCGLYTPTEGLILLDGVDISTLDREAYYRELSVVFQEVFAFAFPIGENVSCEPEADPERLQACLQQADLWEKVSSLPNGVDTNLLRKLDPNGVELSGGQMQKLMLARALYKNAPVILLDEPTAALDPLAEQDMYLKYSSLTQGKTSVFISHRLSSTRFCDRIAFLEGGALTELGDHESLMAQNGGYAHMFQIQSHYYQEEEAV